MQVKIFTIPILGGEAMNEELNAFLRSKKIVQVEDKQVGKGKRAFRRTGFFTLPASHFSPAI